MAITTPNYFNYYDQDKGYSKLLALPGRCLQSQEVNEMQAIIEQNIKDLGNSLYTNGQVISGCQLVINATTLIIKEGKLFLNGKIHKIPKTELVIRATGIENIYARVVQKIITAYDDNELNDPAVGYDNYGEEGAYRLQEKVKFFLGEPDTESTLIFTLKNGVHVNPYTYTTNNNNVTVSELESMLATRSFYENGNYSISGLEVSYYDYNTQHIRLKVSQGKAVVQGYEVVFEKEQLVNVPFAKTTRRVNYEQHYSTGIGTTFELNHQFMSEIHTVTGVVQEYKDNLTHAKSNNGMGGSIVRGVDDLKKYSASGLGIPCAILEVKQTLTKNIDGEDIVETTIYEPIGSDGKGDYFLGRDSYGNIGIDWSKADREPAIGTSLQVTWRYSFTFSESDYAYVTNDGITTLVFDGRGKCPTEGTRVNTSYSYKIYRSDSIAIDRYGTIYDLLGQPDGLDECKPPVVDEAQYLILANIVINPNNTPPLITNLDHKRITQSELKKIYERLDTLEKNVAIADLDREAVSGESVENLAGIYTDGFLTYNKADINHKDFSAFIETKEQRLTLNKDVTQIHLETDTGTTCQTTGDLYTLPYTDTLLIEQPLASSALQLNTYNTYRKTPIIQVIPSMDNLVGESFINIENTSKISNLYDWWNYSRECTILPRIVKIEIYNVESYADNLIVTFNKETVNCENESSVYMGTIAGSLRADKNGYSYGYFRIPENIKCGIIEVTCYQFESELKGYAYYTVKGTSNDIIPEVYKEVPAIQTYTPVAQTFRLDDDDCTITSIGLFFESKDSINAIAVQIRTTYNGSPTSTVLAEGILKANDCISSKDATKETIVKFNRPVLCYKGTTYALVIVSSSEEDKLWAATTTEKDVNGKTIARNTYTNGYLLTSYNGVSWMMMEDTDLTFNLYRAGFRNSAKIVFKRITAEGFNSMALLASKNMPQGTNITWEFEIPEDVEEDSSLPVITYPLDVYQIRELSYIANKLNLVANFTTSNSYVSPAIAADSAAMILYLNQLNNNYVTKNVTLADGYNNIKVFIDVDMNNGDNTLDLYYATDINGNTWKPITFKKLASASSVGYTEYQYENSLSFEETYFRLKIAFGTDTAQISMNMKRLRVILSKI